MQISSTTGVRSAWFVLCLVLGCVSPNNDHAMPVGTAKWTVPVSVVADGQHTARVTLTVTRPSAAAWAGAQLRLLADDAHVLVSNVTNTDANGEASAVVRCTEAGRFTLRAEVVDHGLFWPLDGGVRVLCISAQDDPKEPLNLTPIVLTDPELANPDSPVRIAWVVYDADGRPLANQVVTLSTLRPNDTIAPMTAITNAEGRIEVTLTTQEPGDATVVAQSGAVRVATVVQLGGTVPDAKLSHLVSRSGASLAAQDTTAVFDLDLRDRLNRPVPQVWVALNSDTPSDVFSPQKGRTNGSGRITTTLKRTRAGLRQVTASAANLTWTASVRFAAGPAHASHSRIEIASPLAKADPTQPINVSVTLADEQDNAVSGGLVTLSSSEATDALDSTSSQTSPAGQATFALRSRHAGVRTLTAHIANAFTLSAPLTVLPGEPNITLSQLTASPNNASVGGTVALSSLWVDRFENPIAGQNVVWSGTQGQVFASTTTTSSSVGRAETTVTSTQAGPAQVAATLQSKTLVAELSLQPGAPAQASSSLTLDANVLTADTVSRGVVTVVVRDSYGNPVPHVSVTLSSSGVAVTFTPLQAQTSALGIITATVTSQVAGVSVITAQAGPLTFSAPLTWVAGPAAAAHSTLTATPNTVIANRVDTAALTAKFYDAFGNPTPNQTVNWSGAIQPDVLSAATQITDAQGSAQVTLTSSLAHTATITATLGGVALQVPVSLVAGPAVAAQSSFVVSPNVLVIDGSTWADYTLMLADAWGNPASAQSMTVGAAEPDVTVVQPTASAQAGIFNGRMRSTVAGVKSLTATADGVVLQQGVTFTAGAVDASASTLTATPQNGVWANGRHFLVLSAELADAWGNPAAARSLSFTSESPDTVATPATVTDLSGRASTQVIATMGGTHTLSAHSEQVTLSVPATFTRAASLATSSLTASPNALVVDANTAVSLNLTALDPSGLPVAGAQVTWGGVAPGFTFSPSSSLTDAQGQASTQMRGASATKQTAFAHVTGLQLGTQVVVGPRPPRCANTLYLNEAPWPVGPAGQHGIAAADINHDGRMDLIALNFYGTVTVNLGLGNKLFADPISYSVGPASTALAMADLDDDGELDVIALSAASSRLFVLYGRPDGTFSTPSTFETGAGSEDLAVGDLDGDGLVDVVTASRGSNLAIHVLKTQSGGTLASAVSYSLPASPGGLALGPLLGTSPDVAVSLPSLNQIAVFSQTTSMNFSSSSLISVGVQPGPLVLDDFNGDGRVDLAVGFQGERSCGIILGQQDRSIGAYSSFSVPNNVVALSSFVPSGSGAANIIATSPFSQASYVYQNTGSTNFSLIETHPSGGYTRNALFVADIDGDGTVDFVVPSRTSLKDMPIIYRTASQQNANGDFTSLYIRQALVADYNQDGHLDLILVSYANNHQLRYGRGDGQFDAPINIAAGIQTTSGTVADFDNDGIPDAAMINIDKTISIYLHPSPSATSAATTLPTESTSLSMSAADVDDDGNQDILVANQQTDSVSLFRGYGDGTFQAPQRYSVGHNPRSIAAVDLNLDGLTDIAIANSADGTVAILYNDGFGQLLAPTWVRPNSGATQLAAGDFDGDGLMDLVSMNDDGAKPIEILYNRGTHFLVQAVTEGLDGLTSVATGDVNGDGRPDLIAALSIHNAIKVFINRGDTTFTGGRAYASAGIRPLVVTPADFAESGQNSIFVINDFSHDAAVLHQTDCR